MKLLFIGLAIIATSCAQALSNDDLPPTEEYAGAASYAVDSNTLEYEPDHTLADDGYRYKTVKRFRHRHRRDVSELTNSYLPPHGAASTQSYAVEVETAPTPVYAAPAAQQYEASYETAASEPAHELAADGYRYKTVKRYRLRHRRDVNELTNSYLPPHAASAPAPVYSAPAQTYAETAPVAVYAAPAAQQYEASYETAASEPAHELAADGYRYKTVKRYRLRHRRDVNELTNSYLPPHAASAPAPVYSAPAQTYTETAPVAVYAAPAAQQYEASYETAASEPAHELAADGYRYKTVKRYRLRHRRDVNELTNSYLPPHAASAPEPVYSAPAQTYAETAPVAVYAAPAAQQYEASYETAASEPAHELAADGYRYKTVKRYRLRHRRDVSELTNSYLPPHAASAPAPVYSAPATQSYAVEAESAPALVYSAPAAQHYEASYETAASEPAHTLAADGYRYKTVKRYRNRYRH